MTYITPVELERELPFGPHDLRLDDETEDADGNTEWERLLLDVLGRESSRIETWAATVFETGTTSATLQRPVHVDGEDLPLPERPVVSVESVSVDGSALTEGVDYAVEDTHLVLLDGADIGRWPTERGSVSADWTFGFASPPPEVVDALVRLCRNAIERSQTDGLESESTGDGASYNYRLPGDLLAEVRPTVRAHSAPSYYGGASVF